LSFLSIFVHVLLLLAWLCAGEQVKQREYLARLMGPPNNTWGQILAQAQANPEVLKQQEVIKSLQNVLQTNVSVCTSLGNPYINQMAQMVDSMLQVCGHCCVVGGTRSVALVSSRRRGLLAGSSCQQCLPWELSVAEVTAQLHCPDCEAVGRVQRKSCVQDAYLQLFWGWTWPQQASYTVKKEKKKKKGVTSYTVSQVATTADRTPFPSSNVTRGHGTTLKKKKKGVTAPPCNGRHMCHVVCRCIDSTARASRRRS
jgi:hypothetical protein